ncbi:hypothetical protein PENTCL1PPCAC_21769, partial [Pristionchus entomophagus]
PLQTSHTITLAFVWFLGDLFNRGKLFLISLACWIVLSLLSLILGSESYLIFVVFRALAASASSVYVVLIPVLLADMYKDRALGVALMGTAAVEIISDELSAILSSCTKWNTMAIRTLSHTFVDHRSHAFSHLRKKEF